MDEEITTKAQLKTSKRKTAAIIIGFIGILFIVGGVSYYIGASTIKDSLQKPSPALSALLTPQLLSSNDTPPTLTPILTGKLSGTPTPLPKSLILPAERALDGFQSSKENGNSSAEIKVGSDKSAVYRGLVSFSLTGVPTGVNLLEARLRLYQAKVINNPYQTGINIKVDHLQYGDSIDSSDYGIPAFLSGFATISSDNRKEWKEVAVTSQVNDDIANTRSLSQFRLHFSKELRGEDETGEFAFFESSENFLSTGNTPQLIIKYY